MVDIRPLLTIALLFVASTAWAQETGYGRVRGASPPDYNVGSTSPNAINERGDQLVAQSMSAATEIARRNDSWSVQIATGNAFTNVADMPTTRGELALYNGERSGGKSYVIDSISFLSLTSVTAISNVTLIYQVGTVAAPTDDVAQLIVSPTGASYGGLAQRDLATTAATANKWAIAGAGLAGAGVSIGLSVIAKVDGAIIIAPGDTLWVNAVLGTATGTSLMAIAWHEVQL